MQPVNHASEPGVLKKSIRGGTWLALGYIIQKSLGLIAFFVLARLLTPADFGIMAIVLIVPKFLESASDTGFGAAIIQRTGGINQYLNPIWTIGILKSLVILGITMLGGGYVAAFFHAEAAVWPIRLGGIFICVQNVSNIGETFFFRDLNFKKIFIRNVSREVCYAIIAVLLAWYWRSYSALLLATFISYGVQTVSTYLLHPYRPWFSARWSVLKELVGYSKWIVGQGWLLQLYGLIENSAVARITSVTDFGLYNKAKSIAALAPGLITPLLSMVGFSAYAKIQSDYAKVREGLKKSLDILFFFLVPATTVICLAGGKLILLFLGEQWLPMVGALRLFLILYFISSINDISQSLCNALGRPELQAKLSLLRIVITAAGIIPLTSVWGITGAALALLLGSIPLLVLNIGNLIRLTLLQARDILNAILVPFTASIALTVVAVLFKEPLLLAAKIYFIAAAVVFGLVYLALIFIAGTFLKRGPYPTIRVILKNIF